MSSMNPSRSTPSTQHKNTPAVIGRGVTFDVFEGFLQRRKTVLHAVDFTVAPHRITALVGPNGAGKTTLFHQILGFKLPDAGSVEVYGIPASNPASRLAIGYVPERPYLPAKETPRAFLSLCMRLSGVPARIDRIHELLARVGLKHAIDQHMEGFSKGMLQRLLIAQAMVHDPKLLLLDEPMSGLDPDGRIEVRNIIRELKNLGKTILFTTHVVEDIEWLADDLILIQEGKLSFSGPALEFLAKHPASYEVMFEDQELLQFAGIEELSAVLAKHFQEQKKPLLIKQRRKGIEEMYRK
jgi:ABC-2 type transport system ATP-binding protein